MSYADDGTRPILASRLETDPARFQFRTGTDAKGDCGRLAGVEKWEPEYAGICIAWRDWTGQEWIVDGHHRLALAKRIMAQTGKRIFLRCRVYEEARGITAQDVMRRAALKNVAEGSATAVDVARLIRTGIPSDDLKGKLPAQSVAMQDGRALASLGSAAWGLFLQSDVDPAHAAEVARVFAGDPARQHAAVAVLMRHPQATKSAAKAMVAQLKGATYRRDESSLFDFGAFVNDTLTARTDVLVEAERLLRSQRAAFGNAIRNADRLRAVGNDLTDDANREEHHKAVALAQDLYRLTAFPGRASDLLQEAAEYVVAGEPAEDAARWFVEQMATN